MKRGLLLLAMVGCVSTPPPSKGPKRLSKAKRDRIKARANTNFIDDNIRPTDAAGSEAGANKPGALSRTISNSLPASLCATPIPADKGYVSSVFGWRVWPGHNHKSLHVGVDIAAPTGTPIKSMTKGVVLFADADKEGGGNMVTVLSYHMGKLKLVRYMHLSKFRVKRGDKVNMNTVIGEVGSTGRSTGPHLHVEMAVLRDGLKPKYDDPLKYLCAYKKNTPSFHSKINYNFTLKQDEPIFLDDFDLTNLKSNIIR